MKKSPETPSGEVRPSRSEVLARGVELAPDTEEARRLKTQMEYKELLLTDTNSSPDKVLLLTTALEEMDTEALEAALPNLRRWIEWRSKASGTSEHERQNQLVASLYADKTLVRIMSYITEYVGISEGFAYNQAGNSLWGNNGKDSKTMSGLGAKLENITRAAEHVGLSVRRRANSVAEKALLDAGWSLTESNALVEPGLDPVAVEGAFQEMIDRLSKEQVEAQDLFNADGKIEVYTLNQAVSLIERTRKEAVALRETLDEAMRRADSLAQENADLKSRLQESGEAHAVALTSLKEVSTQKVDEAVAGFEKMRLENNARVSENEERRLALVAREKQRADAIEQLKEALAKKGMFGGINSDLVVAALKILE